jgi:ribosomal protein L29
MKITKVKEEIQALSAQNLIQRADELRRELFTLRLNAATAHIKDYSQIRKLRKNIARTLTHLCQVKKHHLV